MVLTEDVFGTLACLRRVQVAIFLMTLGEAFAILPDAVVRYQFTVNAWDGLAHVFGRHVILYKVGVVRVDKIVLSLDVLDNQTTFSDSVVKDHKRHQDDGNDQYDTPDDQPNELLKREGVVPLISGITNSADHTITTGLEGRPAASALILYSCFLDRDDSDRVVSWGGGCGVGISVGVCSRFRGCLEDLRID
jgi:hypothetical protein